MMKHKKAFVATVSPVESESSLIEGLGSLYARQRFCTIADTAFGISRFFSIYRHWQNHPSRPERLHYVAFVEPAFWDESSACPKDVDETLWELFCQQRPVMVPGMHRLSFADGAVILTLVLGDRTSIVGKMVLGWDALLCRGDEPIDFLRTLLRLSNEGGVVFGARFSEDQKKVLIRSAFRYEDAGAYDCARLLAPRKKRSYRLTDDRQAVVIGAGLAGSNAAYALAQAGWSVKVIDAAPLPGYEASALAWGILHPHFARDDNILSRLSRDGFFATRGLLKKLQSQTGESLFSETGCLQMAHSETIWQEWELARQQNQPFALPTEYADFVSESQAEALCGVALKRGGWWFKQGGMVRVGAFCRALIRAAKVSYRGNTVVSRLEKEGDDWVVYDDNGQAVARTPHVVVACATGSAGVLGMQHLTLDPLQGRITLLRDTDLPGLKAPVSGEGYISHMPDGFCAVGATYENTRLGQWEEIKAHRANLDKLDSILKQEVGVVVTGAYQGVRAVGLGRLPYVGPVYDEATWLQATKSDPSQKGREHPPIVDGLWIMAGMGSRGVSMSTLCARILVSWMDGTPMPIDQRVVRCLHSNRSVRKFLETL